VFREEGYIESLFEFRRLTIAQVRLFLKQIEEDRKLEEANRRAQDRLAKTQGKSIQIS